MATKQPKVEADSEEEEEDLDRYENDGFLNDDEVEDKPKKRKHSKRAKVKTEAPKLDDEEYDLLWENLNTKKRISGENRRKRLKKDLAWVDKDLSGMKLEEEFIDDGGPNVELAEGYSKIKTTVTKDSLNIAGQVFGEDDEDD